MNVGNTGNPCDELKKKRKKKQHTFGLSSQHDTEKREPLKFKVNFFKRTHNRLVLLFYFVRFVCGQITREDTRSTLCFDHSNMYYVSYIEFDFMLESTEKTMLLYLAQPVKMTFIYFCSLST